MSSSVSPVPQPQAGAPTGLGSKEHLCDAQGAFQSTPKLQAS